MRTRQAPGFKPASGYKGVYIRPGGRYRAMVWTTCGARKKGISLGLFKRPELAAAAIARYKGDEAEAQRLEKLLQDHEIKSIHKPITTGQVACLRSDKMGSLYKATF